ncbi:MAG: SCP2 sterol-binding domain-containing protein [Acidimicrobiales bacterium]|nr:SCP2 sterol-binding domain-containing protein [Acidimicrobiales bacterium]
MVTHLSQEWLDLQRELSVGLPPVDGASARIQHVVTGVPGGDVKYSTVIVDGVIAANEVGVDRDAEVTVTTTYDDAVAILRGELDPNAAFMQGRVKVVGDMGPLLSVMPLVRRPERVAAREALAERTEL